VGLLVFYLLLEGILRVGVVGLALLTVSVGTLRTVTVRALGALTISGTLSVGTLRTIAVRTLGALTVGGTFSIRALRTLSVGTLGTVAVGALGVLTVGRTLSIGALRTVAVRTLRAVAVRGTLAVWTLRSAAHGLVADAAMLNAGTTGALATLLAECFLPIFVFHKLLLKYLCKCGA